MQDDGVCMCRHPQDVAQSLCAFSIPGRIQMHAVGLHWSQLHFMHVQVKSDVDDILNAFCTPDTFTESEEVCTPRSVVGCLHVG